MIGTLTVICGCMFSGKSEELMRRLRRSQIKKKVFCFKPRIDNRYSEDSIASHAHNTFPSTPVSSSMEVVQITKDAARSVIGIDEVQFFDPDIIPVIFNLMKNNNDIVVSGLDLDYENKPFSITSTLMAHADKVFKFSAICMKCGSEATKTYRKDKMNYNRVAIGGTDLYEPRCTTCHQMGD